MEKFFRGRSIKKIISVSFTLASVLGVIILSNALYMKFKDINEDSISKNNEALIRQVNLSLDGYLKNMMSISDYIYYSIAKKHDFSKGKIDDYLKIIYDINRENIENIAIFSEDGNIISGYPYKEIKNSTVVREANFFKEANKTDSDIYFSKPTVQNIFKGTDYKWVVPLSRPIEINKEGNIFKGVLLIYMKFSGIERIFKNIEIGKDGYIYLIGKDGEIIYHPRTELIYSKILNENNLNEKDFEDGSYKIKDNKKEYISSIKTVSYTGWKIVSKMPRNDIKAGYKSMAVFTFIAIVASIIIIIWINKIISKRVTEPILRLEEKALELEAGIIDVDFNVEGSREIENLSESLQTMVNQMKVLMENMVREEEIKRKNELDVLQSQINPHFLYNTLDSIVWMIECEKYEGAIKMVTSLARLFRISLSKGENIITLKDEFEHGKNYLLIQNIRFKHRFEYEISCDKEIENNKTLKLIIQPLIENAIYHGMANMYDDGLIEVKGYRKGEFIIIEINDNGLGMREEEVQNLINGISKSKKGSGVGFKNVNERIKLYFGEEYGLSIISTPDEGTRIKIKLPFKKEQ